MVIKGATVLHGSTWCSMVLHGATRSAGYYMLLHRVTWC